MGKVSKALQISSAKHSANPNVISPVKQRVTARMSTAKPPPPRPPTREADNALVLGLGSNNNSGETDRNTQPPTPPHAPQVPPHAPQVPSHAPVPAPRRSGTGRLSMSWNSTQVGLTSYLITVGVEIKECQRACGPMSPAETVDLLVSKINGELRKFGMQFRTDVLAEFQAGIANLATQLYGNTRQYCCVCRNLLTITIQETDV